MSNLLSGAAEGVPIFIAVIIIPVLALVGSIIAKSLTSYELTVTDKRIYGSLKRGKRVDLPLDSISAVGIGAFRSITVSTASGRIAFSHIKNRNEIHQIVSKLLVERQTQPTPSVTTSVPTAAPTPATSNADELKKYKELFDMGVISQEEFDAKKKQLLGL
ncbi:MAG: SHOCT domain-containing protein [Oscillospiraceae bacterium]|nr:SHOCT domain-containing protein [Oscillospiraceae bacterium]